MPPAKGSFAGVVVEDHDVQKKMRDGWHQGRDRMNAAELYGTSVWAQRRNPVLVPPWPAHSAAPIFGSAANRKASPATSLSALRLVTIV